jgi:hypothetical protein
LLGRLSNLSNVSEQFVRDEEGERARGAQSSRLRREERGECNKETMINLRSK